MSKLNYADLLCYPLSEFLLRRLERVQFAASSVVLGHYVKNFRDVLKIRWLPINERRDLNLLKSRLKALHNTEAWPGIKQECRKEPSSSNAIRDVTKTRNGERGAGNGERKSGNELSAETSTKIQNGGPKNEREKEEDKERNLCLG